MGSLEKKMVKVLTGTMAAALLCTAGPALPGLPQELSKVEAAGVKISAKKITLIKKQSKTLTLTGWKKNVKWSSSRKSVASVSSKGKVTARSEGTAVIKAKTGSKKFTCKVRVENPRLSETKMTLAKGKSSQLKLKGTKQKVIWSSSNKEIASVSPRGKVTGRGKGTASVTAQVSGVKFTCKVTVKPASAIKEGSLSGNILNALGEEDKNAQIILIPENKKARSMTIQNPSAWSTARNGIPEFGIYGGKTDGSGNYRISHVPAGSYTCVLISSYNSGSTDIDDYDEFDDYVQDYLSVKSIESLREYIRGKDFSVYSEIEIEKNKTEELEEDFQDYIDTDEDDDDDEYDDIEDEDDDDYDEGDEE